MLPKQEDTEHERKLKDFKMNRKPFLGNKGQISVAI